MRDIAVTFLFLFLIIYTIKRPYIGVCAWLWVALAYPAGWAWGFSSSFRMNMTVALLTMLSYMLYKNKPKIEFNGTTWVIILFWCLGLISCIVSESLIIDHAWAKFTELSKILLLYFFVILVLDKKIHIDTLVWSIVLAVSSYAAMEASKFIVSGGGHRIAGISGHVLGDRNDLAVAINMCIPLLIYLYKQVQHKKLQLGLSVLLVLNIVAVVGTYSRGGFVGLIIVAGYFFLKSKRKVLWVLAMIIMTPIAISNAPSEWTDRMDTVTEAQTDSSFVGRLWAWKVSVKIANDNVFGNGFFATQDPIAWNYYGQDISDFGFIYTPPIPEGQYVKAAHSIYFQVLGDLGYIGLLLFILLVFSLLLKANKLQKLAIQKDIPWCADLCAMLSISSVAYAMTGANVSLAYFDLFFTLLALLCVIEKKILNSTNIENEQQRLSKVVMNVRGT